MASFWDRFKSAFAAKGLTSQAPVASELFLPQWAQPPKRGTKELIQAYKTHPWLRSVAYRIAGGVASTEWRLYVRARKAAKGVRSFRFGEDEAVYDRQLRSNDREARRERVKELSALGELRELDAHPLLDLLERPNRGMTGLAALGLQQTYLDLKGESFWPHERNADGMPIGYYPLPPHWVIATPSRNQPNYRVSLGAVQVEFKPEDMIHLRHLDPENPFGRGTGLAESLGDELETDEYAAKTVKAWFYNRAIPELLVSIKGQVSKEQLKIAQEMWEQRHQGIGNGSRANFMGGDVTVTRLDSTFRDQQYIELRKNQRDFVRQVFGVPPEVMGIIENSNRATSQAAFFHFAEGVLVPRLEFLRTGFQQWLVPQFDERLCLEYESPVPEDKEFKLKVYTSMPAAFSLNEHRVLAGDEPVAELEGVFPPLAMPGQSAAGANEKDPADAEGSEDTEPGEPAEPSDVKWAGDLRAMRKAK